VDIIGGMLDIANADTAQARSIDFTVTALCYASDFAASSAQAFVSITRITGSIAHGLQACGARPLPFSVRVR